MAIEPNVDGLAPAFDFEIDDPLANIKTMLLMSRPSDPKRSAIAAKFGVYLLGVVESTYVALMTQAAARASAGGIPELGALDRLIAGCSDDPTHRHMLRGFAMRFAAECYPDAPEGSEMLFWLGVSHPQRRKRLSSFPAPAIDELWRTLIAPNGGFIAGVSGEKSLEAVEMKFRSDILGYPMLAGLVLFVISVLATNHMGHIIREEPKRFIRASLNEACEIIDRSDTKLALSKQGHTRDTERAKLLRTFSEWRSVAHLWAAVLVEANCWSSNCTPDFGKLVPAVYDVLLTDIRRNRMIGLAKSFSSFASTHYPAGSNADRILIPSESLVLLPDRIDAIPPILPGLSEADMKVLIKRSV
jgi:hypothetical protein